MALTPEQEIVLRKLWADGVSHKDIAKELGCFKHCNDKGRAAICGIVHRKREAAKENKNEEELNFWSHRKKDTGNSRPRRKAAPRSRTMKTTSNFGTTRQRESPLSLTQIDQKIESVVVPKIEWPTEDEVRKTHIAQMVALSRQ